jgi:hypothetical protein
MDRKDERIEASGAEGEGAAAPLDWRVSPWRLSPAKRPPLRIGLLLDDENLSRFAVRIVEDIQASNFARIELLVFRKRTPAANPATPKNSKSRLGGLKKRMLDPKLRKGALYDLYLRFDKRKKAADHPLDRIDGSQLLAGTERMEVEPIGKKFIQRFQEEDLEKIRAKNLDVLIRFGFNILHGGVLEAARYGVWSYHHGDNEFYRGGPPHFWELVEENQLSGVMLQVLTEELDAGLVLCKSLFPTQSTLSVSANRYAPYWGSTDFIIRKLNELHQFGWEHLKKNAVAAGPYQGKKKLYRQPTNVEIARWLGPVLLKKAAQQALGRGNRVQHWQIGIRVGHAQLYEDSDLRGFRWIDASKGHFWADPFGFEHEGKSYVFFEDYSYEMKRAGIVCSELKGGQLATPVSCLDTPDRHYSYPFVFRAGREIYMVPESYDSNSVDLFRCRTFPHAWEHERTLFQGRFVDTTIWEQHGLWWLMTTWSEPNPRAGSLMLFFAEAPTGPWKFHPASPVSTDARFNRGAGSIIEVGDRWIRPSQSSSPIYGYSFAFHEITKLSRSEYSERILMRVTPEFWRRFCAVHTYNRVGNCELIDGARWTRLKDIMR